MLMDSKFKRHFFRVYVFRIKERLDGLREKYRSACTYVYSVSGLIKYKRCAFWLIEIFTNFTCW